MDAVIQHFFVLLLWSGKTYALENFYGAKIITRQLLATSAVDSVILFIGHLLSQRSQLKAS